VLRAVAAAVLPRDRTQTPPLALPISRFRCGSGVKPKVQAASGTQSGDGATVRYLLRRLRRKKTPEAPQF